MSTIYGRGCADLKEEDFSEKFSPQAKREALARLSLYLHVDKVLQQFPVCILFPWQLGKFLDLDGGQQGTRRLLRGLQLIDGSAMSSGVFHIQARLHCVGQGGYLFVAQRVAGEPLLN